METVKQIITDKQIDEVWENADFGNIPKREVIKGALLKCALEYHNGHTADCIIKELGLITTKQKLTKMGKEYLYAACYSQAQNNNKAAQPQAPTQQ